MEIRNPKVGEAIETPCTGCPCHWNPGIQMGSRLCMGCCGECGCPKTELAWHFWKRHGRSPREGDSLAETLPAGVRKIDVSDD